jgi:hypothetical protein
VTKPYIERSRYGCSNYRHGGRWFFRNSLWDGGTGFGSGAATRAVDRGLGQNGALEPVGGRAWGQPQVPLCPRTQGGGGVGWDYYREKVSAGKWKDGQELANNVLRKFKTLCRQAEVGKFTIHDLRRSCITNWAKELPIHVVKELAGHSEISTTQQYYLSIQSEDMDRTSKAQEAVLGQLPTATPTDPKLTHFARKREFSGPQGCQPKKKTLD